MFVGSGDHDPAVGDGSSSAGEYSFPVVGELVIPILPCRDLDESVAFYEVIGFRCTYRQRRPNPYAVVAREDMQLHIAGINGFDPEQSYGSAIVVVPDADAFYAELAERLRGAYGKLPSVGIPRILRPRKRHGTVRGFSIVDPGGNWLRVFRAGDSEEAAAEERTSGLERVIEHAARLADARGDDQAGLELLVRGLERHRGAPAAVRVQALMYRAELSVRTGDVTAARAAMNEGLSIGLSKADRREVAELIEHTTEVVSSVEPQSSPASGLRRSAHPQDTSLC